MKNLLLALTLVITASPAFASRARLESLGEGKNGSYYINDGRNIFLNPASINNYKKKVFLELGTNNAAADAIGSSKGQGGFTNTFGDFVYGVYMNRESDRAFTVVTGANTATGLTFTNQDHTLDVFFGGQASDLKYGIDLYYAGGLDQSATAKKTSSIFAAKLGVDVSNLAVFTTVGISSSSKIEGAAAATSGEAKGKLSLDVGATYTMDDMTYLAKFTTFGSDITGGNLAAASTTYTGKTMALGLGAGWKKEASKAVTMFSRVQLDYQKDTVDSVTGSTTTAVSNSNYYNLPLVLAAEAAATSWLTVRGSISHSLLGQSTSGATKTSLNNLTAVAAGLGFNFGDLTVDALFGQSAALAAAGTESSQGNVQSGGAAGTFGMDGTSFASRLAMTYNF